LISDDFAPIVLPVLLTKELAKLESTKIHEIAIDPSRKLVVLLQILTVPSRMVVGAIAQVVATQDRHASYPLPSRQTHDSQLRY
jgi:hypothetical protein